METLHFNGVFKVEKPKKKKKVRDNVFHLRKVANLFRLIELCVLLILLLRFTLHLPVAVKSSGEYFRDLKFTLSSPSFVFILGNVIVVTLFATSDRFSDRKVDFYDEFVQKSERVISGNPSVCRTEVTTKCEEKKVIFEEKAAPYRRSQSEKRICHVSRVKVEKELKRSKTEDFEKAALSIEGPFPEDSLSNDEFRKTIEAFIARQQRFLREDQEFNNNNKM